jgi:hypothetical protein
LSVNSAEAQGETPTNGGLPALHVGATIFGDDTSRAEPQITDDDDSTVDVSAFKLTRSDINLTGTASRLVARRISSDNARESTLDSVQPTWVQRFGTVSVDLQQ